jgi:hypothetical protein
VKYIDLTSGVVKTSLHATFDEAWYLQLTRPPAAQLLYDMGLEYDDDDDDDGLSASLDAAFVPTPITQLPVHFNDAKYPPVPPRTVARYAAAPTMGA